MSRNIWKYFAMVGAVILLALAARGQGTIHGLGSPSTVKPDCLKSPFYVDDATGNLYTSPQKSPCVWAQPGSGGGSPGGSSAHLQYNNSGAFGGAAGGTTNGTHFAFGAESAIDGVSAAFPDTQVAATKVVSTDAESYAGPDLENGLYLNLNLNPSSAATNGSFGAWIQNNADGSNWAGTQDFTGLVAAANYSGIGTGASAMPEIVADQVIASNTNAGEIGNAWNSLDFIINSGSGTIDTAYGPISQILNNGAGTIAAAQEFTTFFFSQSGATTENDGLVVGTPVVVGSASLGIAKGIDIKEQCGAGITSCYEMDSEGTGLNHFGGAVKADVGFQETLTTPASSSAECTAGQFTDDANYHYVCTATNTWKRAALSTF